MRTTYNQIKIMCPTCDSLIDYATSYLFINYTDDEKKNALDVLKLMKNDYNALLDTVYTIYLEKKGR